MSRTARPPAAVLDPWVAGAQIGRQLGAWAALSVATRAALLLASDDAAARAFGVQCLVWGAIDGAIVLAGGLGLRRARARGAVGVALLLAWRTEAGGGHGCGVVVQGGFLLVFDAVHAWRLREPAAAARRS
ncbi:MAG: hypothetical protein P1P87_11185 [Trueperaceae bacterium]|nr:hypothetical protein [Trueperaceae bacterium]